MAKVRAGVVPSLPMHHSANTHNTPPPRRPAAPPPHNGHHPRRRPTPRHLHRYSRLVVGGLSAASGL